MKKLVVAVAVVSIATVFGAVSVIAQSNPIAARIALMKENTEHARTIGQMIRDQAPFDAAKVEVAFAQWADTARKLPGLFPETSKTGDNTRAAPKIWQTKADFDAKAAAFGKAVADNRANAVISLDGLKASYPAVSKACSNCHEDYRLARQ